MWTRRPYAQLAGCAEARALRKAFPELGSAPTADEMEGKEIDMGAAEVIRDEPKRTPPYPAEQMAKNLPVWTEMMHTDLEGSPCKSATVGVEQVHALALPGRSYP